MTPALEEQIETRRLYFKKAAADPRLPALEGTELCATSVCPILSNGDINGAVVFAATRSSEVATETEEKLIVAAAGFLSKNIDE